jgi:hypothetical protein
LKVDEANVADCWELTPAEKSLVMCKNKGSYAAFLNCWI